MIARQLQEAIKPRTRPLHIIWGTFLAASVVYVIVAKVMARNPENIRLAGEAATLDVGLLRAVFAVAAVLLAVASFVYPRLTFNPERLAQAPQGAAASLSPVGAVAAAAAAAEHLSPCEQCCCDSCRSTRMR